MKLVVQTEQKVLCYPLTFDKIAIPKYRVSAVEFRKGGAAVEVVP